MAWLNTLLSLGAYGLGFGILVGYPFYQGIESTIEIILTPIGLVFVLEIDNWVYEIAKQFYPEASMEELWIFKSSVFKNKPYVECVSEVANAVAILYYISTNIFIGLIVAFVIKDIDWAVKNVWTHGHMLQLFCV